MGIEYESIVDHPLAEVFAWHTRPSAMTRLVSDQVEDLEMPPVSKRVKYPALNRDEIVKLTSWIKQGANWPQGSTLHAPEK